MIRTLIRNAVQTLLTSALPVHYHMSSGDPIIYLTFDDGPTQHTLRILELLNRHGVHATFFILGNRVAENADILRTLDTCGHAIGNHSFSHHDSRKLTAKVLREDLDRCDAAILGALPAWKPQLYRPPFGHLSAAYLFHATRRRRQVVMWSRDSKDYRAGSAETVRESMRNIRPGDILLFHDEFPVTLQALAWLIPYYLDRGLQLAAMDPAALSASAP